MATAKITQLIDRRDNAEVIRDEIASILVLESSAQQALAATTYDPIVPVPGTNTGTGTCSLVTVTGTPAVGTWTLVCNTAVPDGGIFSLLDPDGATVSAALAIVPETATVLQAGGIQFTLTPGAVDFEPDDSFSFLLATRDPALWRLRVFLERSNPWSEFIDAPDGVLTDASPIVNVSLDNVSYEMSGSNTVERQKATGIYHIDCYGYGCSVETFAGHDPGDELAATEAMRAARLCRSILMAGHYAYLGFPRGSEQVVWRRWPQSITAFQPQVDSRPVQQVLAVRFALQVEFNEFSPQVQGQPLELISLTVRRKENSEVVLLRHRDFTPVP
jgi:hypothetical protein